MVSRETWLETVAEHRNRDVVELVQDKICAQDLLRLPAEVKEITATQPLKQGPSGEGGSSAV